VIDGVFMKGPANEWYLQEGHIECPLFMSSTDIEMIMSPRGVNSREELANMANALPGVDAQRLLAAFGDADSAEEIKRVGAVSGIEMAAHAVSRVKAGKVPVWMARFSAEIPGWDHPGCFHSSDIWFYFESLSKCWRVFRGKHYDLARQMCDYWANFIRTGDPNGKGTDGDMLPAWPALEQQQPRRMEFGETAFVTDAQPSPLMEILLEGFLRAHGVE